MRYGLEFPNAGVCGDARVLAELAQLAEASGWDGVFLEDYITHWSNGRPAIRGSRWRRWRCGPTASASAPRSRPSRGGDRGRSRGNWSPSITFQAGG